MKSHASRSTTIEITDLKIQTRIGTNDWEQTKLQPVILNIRLEYDATRAVSSDDLVHALDYKALKKRVILFVKNAHDKLLERLTNEVLCLIMNDRRVLAATVRIDKPRALRFAKSVSVSMSATRAR